MRGCLPETTMEKDSEKFNRLRAIRRGHRSVNTKLIAEANGLLEGTLNDDQLTRLDVISRLLEDKRRTLNDINDQVLSLCEVNDIEAEIQESEAIVERIVDCKQRINEAVRKRREQQTTPIIQQASTTNGDGQPQSTANAQAKAKLPKLTLPKFKGDVTNWITFWDSFKSAVHDNAQISSIDKFNYLNSLLEGAAARTIQGLTLSEDNYASAIDLLQERFGKPQQIISAHMDELLKIQACSSERTTSLRFVYDKISVHVRGLASLGISSKEYGSLLIPILMSKFPSDIRLQIARKTTNEVWEIEELLETIKREIEAREASEAVKANANTQKPFNAAPQRRPPPTTSTFVSKEENSQFKIRCAYCNGLHYSASCEHMTDVNERRDALRKNNRCFICLKSGHRATDCKSTKKCRHCEKRHHQSLCDQTNRASSSAAAGNAPSSDRNETVSTNTTTKKGTVLLQTAKVLATNAEGTKSTDVRILFDNGSQRSYVTNSVKSRLHLKPCKSETLHLNTFGDDKFRKQSCEVVNLCLKKPGGEEIQIQALSFPVICSSLPNKVDVSFFPHLDGLELADNFNDHDHSSIDVLIGADFYWDVITGETVRGENGPTAVSSRVGWILSGPVHDSIRSNTFNSNLVISGDSEMPFSSAGEDELVDSLKQFWETESIGIHEPELQKEDEKQEFMTEVTHNGERYDVGLPWKEELLPIPSHYQQSYNRLRSLHHKLKKEPQVLQEYDKIIKEQLQTGVIEEVPKDEVDNKNSEDVHYWPHHAVIRQDRETTKLRIVYDGSAKLPKHERSLNDCLQTGPNYIPQLIDVLIKFRWNPIAITADIEKAFLMVGINESNRDMLRFLWLRDPHQANPEIVHMRFCRLVFGLRPSPAILGATIRHHLDLYKEEHPALVELIKKSLYVDDLITGDDSVDNAISVYKNSKKIMSEGGFNLRKWKSNSDIVTEAINRLEDEPATGIQAEVTEEDSSFTKATLGSSEPRNDKIVKTLGVHWNTLQAPEHT